MSQNGKGKGPEKGRNFSKFREGFENIRWGLRCDICGRYISDKEITDGVAIRNLISVDTEYSAEDYETFHVKCKNDN